MANRSPRGFAHVALLVVLIVALAGVGFLVYRHNHSATSSTAKSSAKNSAIITDLQFSKAVDGKGAPLSSTTQFSTTDPTIYAVVTLKNPAKNTRLEFVRYRNDKFVGNGSLKVAKDGAGYAGFMWNAKTSKAHPRGTYKVKVYTNGRFERSATYTVN